MSRAFSGAAFATAILVLGDLALWLTARAAAVQVGTWPSDAGYINVRDFGAKGDGRNDDTAAIIRALDASGGRTGREVWHDRLVYLPRGTYLVSAPLTKHYKDGTFASGLSLIGDGERSTIIRLAPRTPGYTDSSAPRAIIFTSSQDLDKGGSKDYRGKGEGNDAYENFVENLTVDVGAGNPGAIAIDFLANNVGAVRHVVIRSDDGDGAIGVSMRRAWPGPALLEHVRLSGFRTGIDVSHTEYGMTLSDVILDGQRTVGLQNDGNLVSAERLDIEERQAQAVVNRGAAGMLVLVGGVLRSANAEPVSNKGLIVFRGTAIASGLAGNLSLRNGWQYGRRWQDLPPQDAAMPAPSNEWRDPSGRWKAVRVPVDRPALFDAAPSVQAALSSGAATIYLPHDTYWIGRPLIVPLSVRRIIGFGSTLRPLRPVANIVTVDTTGPPLSIDHLAFDNTGGPHQTAVLVSGLREVLLRDVLGVGVVLLQRNQTGGQTFLDDVCCGQIRIAGVQPVIARQLDSEGTGIRIRNDGGHLELLGLKTEQNCTAIETTGGGETNVMGGLLYLVKPPTDEPRPAFTSIGSTVSLSFVDQSLIRGGSYQTYLSGTRGGVLLSEQASIPRGFGRFIPYLSATPR